MKRFIAWLADRILPDEEPHEPPLWRTSLGPTRNGARRQRDVTKPSEFSAAAASKIEDGDPGLDETSRNRYVRERTSTHETLKIFSEPDEPNNQDDQSDPYNSGRFDRSKSWNSCRPRK